MGEGGREKEVSRLTALDLSSKLGFNACLDISLGIFVSLLITTFWENSLFSKFSDDFKMFFFAKFKMENKFKF